MDIPSGSVSFEMKDVLREAPDADLGEVDKGLLASATEETLEIVTSSGPEDDFIWQFVA